MIRRRGFLQAAGLGLPVAFSSLAKELQVDIVTLGGGKMRCSSRGAGEWLSCDSC